MTQLIELRNQPWVVFKIEDGDQNIVDAEIERIRFAGIDGEGDPVFLAIDSSTGEFYDPTGHPATFGFYWFEDYPPPFDMIQERIPELKRGSLGKHR